MKWFKKAEKTTPPVDYTDVCSNLVVNGIACRTPCEFCEAEYTDLEKGGE